MRLAVGFYYLGIFGLTGVPPERLSSAIQNPPTSALAMPPVRGDLAPTALRALPGRASPVTGPRAKISLLSGPKGSIPGSNSFHKK